MIISIASDHAGFEQKQLLAAYLEEKGYEVHDLGPDSDDAKVAHEVAGGVATYGVLVCGTGIGMAVAANKINGIRAVNAINTQFAELCREHNDANIVTLSGRFVDVEENKRILDVFLSTDFGGGRHTGRVEKIMALEKPSA